MSTSTFLTGFRSACNYSNMHPIDVDNRACRGTRVTAEFDVCHPSQLVLSPTETNADGTIDIVMSNRHGQTYTRTELDDALAWDQNRNETIPLQERMFDWENHLNDASSLRDVFEFVLNVSREKQLSLEDITVSPKAVTSVSDKGLVLQVWAKSIDQHLKDSKDDTHQGLVNHAQQLMSAYMNSDKADGAKPKIGNSRKRGRYGNNNDGTDVAREKQKIAKRKKDHKYMLIAKSAKMVGLGNKDYSEVSVSSGSRSSETRFGKRLETKDGQVIIDVERTFLQNFPRVLMKLKKKKIPVELGSKRSSDGYLCYGVDNETTVPSGDCEYLPQSLTTTTTKRDAFFGSHWYPSKRNARLAFMWYCLYCHSDKQWRSSWLQHLIGEGNEEVEVCRKGFDRYDSTFTLNSSDVFV